MGSKKISTFKGIDAEKSWELARAQERFFIDLMQKTYAFFSSLISALFAATIAGGMNADQPIHFIILLAGPILIVFVAQLGKAATMRFYRRFLEIITTIAKLESDLGVTNPENRRKAALWAKESIVPNRYIENQKKFSSSEEFIESMLEIGYRKIMSSTFVAFQIVAFGIALIFGYLALSI